MPCWRHEAHISTLSNTWFLCDDCRTGFFKKASTSEGALAASLPKAGSELAGAHPQSPPSPPPGARPERDPVLYHVRQQPDAKGHYGFRCLIVEKQPHDAAPPSPPIVALPERDPAFDLSALAEGEDWTAITPADWAALQGRVLLDIDREIARHPLNDAGQPLGYLSNEDPGDQA